MKGSSSLVRPLGMVVVLAAAVMFAGLFTPFVRQGCIECPIALPGTTFQLPTFSLMHGLDGWVVLCVVVAVGFFGAAYLRIGDRILLIVSFLFSLAAMGLCIFEGVDSAGRVVGLDAEPKPIELGGASSGIAHSIQPPAYWNVGFYLFLCASLVAVIASLAAVLLSRSSAGTPRDAFALPIPAAE